MHNRKEEEEQLIASVSLVDENNIIDEEESIFIRDRTIHGTSILHFDKYDENITPTCLLILLSTLLNNNNDDDDKIDIDTSNDATNDRKYILIFQPNHIDEESNLFLSSTRISKEKHIILFSTCICDYNKQDSICTKERRRK